MSDDEKEPGEEPKEEAQEKPAEEAGAGEADEAGLNRAERRRRKHKRKGELRQLHDRDRSFPKQTKGHGGRVHRRKAI